LLTNCAKQKKPGKTKFSIACKPHEHRACSDKKLKPFTVKGFSFFIKIKLRSFFPSFPVKAYGLWIAAVFKFLHFAKKFFVAIKNLLYLFHLKFQKPNYEQS